MSKWPVVLLGTVCKVIAGQSPEGRFYNKNGEGVPFYQGKKDFGDRFIKPPSTWTTSTTRLATKGDILMSVRAPVGPINECDTDICIGRGLAAIRASELLDTNYLWYQLLSLQPKISGTEGAVFASISRAQIEGLPIVLPPIDVQLKIVEALDEFTEKIALASKALQHAESDVSALLGACVDDYFESYEESAPLTTLCEVLADGDWIESKDQSPNGIRLIQTGNVGNATFRPKLNSARYISEDTFHRLGCTEIVAGDCLVSRLPDPVGRACLIPDTGERMITAVDCAIVRTKDSLLLPETFVYFTLSERYKSQIREKITGTTRDRISRTNLGMIQVPVIPIDEQQHLIEQFETISRLINDIAKRQEQTLLCFDELNRSLAISLLQEVA